MSSVFLLVVIIKAVPKGMPTGSRWEMLSVDNIVVTAQSINELVARVERLKTGLADYGLKVDETMGKASLTREEHTVKLPSGHWPCDVCRLSDGQN